MAQSQHSAKADRIIAWMKRQECLCPKALHCVRGLWACLQRELSFEIGSPASLAVGLVRLLLLMAASCTPVWFKHFEKADLEWSSAITASGLLFGLVVAEKLIAITKETKASRERSFRLASQFGGRLASLVPIFKSLPEKQKTAVLSQIDAMLALMLAEAKIYLREGADGDLAANLWLFTDGYEKMQLRSSTAERPHVVLPSTHLVAFYVAKSGTAYVLHDYKHLAKSKIASHKPKFRSIFYMSLELMPPAVDKQCCIGMVTLTSSEPYRFWPSRSFDSLRVALAPHLSLLTLFLVDRHINHSVPIDGIEGD